MQTILVEVREVYGTQHVYPVCEKAKFFCQLTGKKTLTHAMLCVIEANGYAIKQVLKNIRFGG